MSKIYAHDNFKNKIILCGDLRGETFYKNVKSYHFFKICNGYGIQETGFQEICEKKCKKVIISESDTNQSWISTIKDWKEHGAIKDFGSGKQRFLSMKYMKGHKEPTVIEQWQNE